MLGRFAPKAHWWPTPDSAARPSPGRTQDVQSQALLYATAENPLIGEDVFAGGAYLNAGLFHRGSLRAQDLVRVLIVAGVLIATLLKTLGLSLKRVSTVLLAIAAGTAGMIVLLSYFLDLPYLSEAGQWLKQTAVLLGRPPPGRPAQPGRCAPGEDRWPGEGLGVQRAAGVMLAVTFTLGSCRNRQPFRGRPLPLRPASCRVDVDRPAGRESDAAGYRLIARRASVFNSIFMISAILFILGSIPWLILPAWLNPSASYAPGWRRCGPWEARAACCLAWRWDRSPRDCASCWPLIGRTETDLGRSSLPQLRSPEFPGHALCDECGTRLVPEGIVPGDVPNGWRPSAPRIRRPPSRCGLHRLAVSIARSRWLRPAGASGGRAPDVGPGGRNRSANGEQVPDWWPASVGDRPRTRRPVSRRLACRTLLPAARAPG